jgi:hypothetical protein
MRSNKLRSHNLPQRSLFSSFPQYVLFIVTNFTKNLYLDTVLLHLHNTRELVLSKKHIILTTLVFINNQPVPSLRLK